MALIANVALTDTFDIWRTRTNQLAVQSNAFEGNILDLYNRGNNSPSYAYANNIGVQANAFASATIAGANTFVLATIAGANAAVGLGANSYANVVWARANTRMDLAGQQANAFASATIAGANSAVGAGANAYALSINSVSGTGFIATIDGANTAVGAGANSYANVVWARANSRMDLGGTGANTFASVTIAGANTAVGAGANAHMRATLAGANTAVGQGANNFASATIAGANTAVGTGANNFASATIAGANTAVGNGANNFMRSTLAGANTAVGTGANNFTIATLNGANTAARDATNLTSGTVPSARITGVGTITTGTWNGTVIGVLYGGTGGNDQATARTGLGLGTISTQASSAVTITGGTISGITSLAVSGAITATGDITAYNTSDRRLKTNISQIQDSLHKVNSINGVTFDWNEEGQKSRQSEEEIFGNRREAGVIAQEIEEVLPEVVVTRKDGYKAVRYEKLVPLLIEAIKELTAKVEMLESKIEK